MHSGVAIVGQQPSSIGLTRSHREHGITASDQIYIRRKSHQRGLPLDKVWVTHSVLTSTNCNRAQGRFCPSFVTDSSLPQEKATGELTRGLYSTEMSANQCDQHPPVRR